jgi:hypothetical protein
LVLQAGELEALRLKQQCSVKYVHNISLGENLSFCTVSMLYVAFH